MFFERKIKDFDKNGGTYMVSVSWDKFKALYAVETLQGYTETEIGLLKKIFGTLPCVLED